MTNEEAARILDPATSAEALQPYALDCVMRLAVVEEACRMGAEALRASGWISVKDGLPDSQADVLVVAYWHERWQTMIGWHSDAGKKWRVITPHGERAPGGVTHWMPLPPAPEVENAETK